MTDVNPQFRYRVMSEVYGECGVGWKYEVTSLDRFVCDGGEILQFARVNVYTRQDGEWSAPIPGSGGAKLCAMEKGSLRFNDEAEKMAITDALSVALKMLGVASAVYEGRWDGSKYRDDGKKEDEEEVKPDLDLHVVKRLEESLSLSSLQNEYGKLTKEQRIAHAAIKDAVKKRLTDDPSL